LYTTNCSTGSGVVGLVWAGIFNGCFGFQPPEVTRYTFTVYIVWGVRPLKVAEFRCVIPSLSGVELL
jgi:hypothetical protein